MLYAMPVMVQSGQITITGNRVKVARVGMGWTMRQAAAASGVSTATWCRIESGEEPSLHCAMRVARALGFAIEELWKIDG
jgi:DNA-binding XRE family transcriptional regulator